MSVGQIAVRYAKALFQSAMEKDLLDAVRSDMEQLIESISGIPELKSLIDSPIVDLKKKAEVLTAVFSGTFQALSLNFIRLVTSNKREEYLEGMAHHFITLYKNEKGIQVALLSSVIHLDAKTKEQIRKIIAGAFKSEIELKEEIKKDLIGGFVLRVEDKQLDASVKGKLAEIKKELQK